METVTLQSYYYRYIHIIYIAELYLVLYTYYAFGPTIGNKYQETYYTA